MTHPNEQKMLYRLEPDEDGYPPFSIEGLWVRSTSTGTVVLDSIPFFARGIAPGDELRITVDAAGQAWFDGVASSGGASVFRIRAHTDEEVAKIREDLLGLGMQSEVDAKLGLIAVEVSLGADIRPMLDYLVSGRQSGRFDFEEGALRHALP